MFIEATSSYTYDGRFIKNIKNNVGDVTTYDIDDRTGLIKKITNPHGHSSNYVYNTKFRILNISSGEKNISYEYDINDNLVRINNGSKNYIFEYDEFNNQNKVKINDITLIENIYENNNGNLAKNIYGNGNEISYIYDEFNRLKSVIKSDNIYTNYYDNLGRITKLVSNNETSIYEYDFSTRLSKFKIKDYETSINYDKESNLLNKKEKLNNQEHIYNYTNDSEGKITELNLDNALFQYKYDKLGRLIENSINNYYAINYYYITNGNKTTSIINKVKDNGVIYSYNYDKLGNITEIKKENIVIKKYYYDEHSQLITDEDLETGIKTLYTYDNYGNMLSSKKYEIETNNLISEDTYLYENTHWQDCLTKFNNNTITYDEIGNPLSIGNKNLSWKNGRELASYNDGENEILYKYDGNGIRTEKIINGITTKYILEGTRIIFEDRNGVILYYIYNGSELIGFVYDNKTYYYHKNIFNDIIGILDINYNEIVKYEYDSWGKLNKILDTSQIDLGVINPFRYRSYYYDTETQLYYLNSRYYDANCRRFINGDSLITNQGIIGCNLFAYCGNNPATRSENGYSWYKSLTNKLSSGMATIKNKLSSAVNKGKQQLLKAQTTLAVIKNSLSLSSIYSIAKNKIETELNRIKKKIIIEWGTGIGMGSNVAPGQVSLTWGGGYKDGQEYEYTRDTGTIFGQGVEMTHEKDMEHSFAKIFNFPWEIHDCPNTDIDISYVNSYDIGILSFGDDGTVTIGISFYFIAGFDFTLGYKFD